ncbi:peptide/nickel transport system substrate-binding protein [Sulfitobacter brevis]|uniref:Peptide/nickel transport system substrate-binding protein n=1 Tax=Sulfitobacter brevis TaxID=74348 RepID=A0A1I2DY29_9RHOB|nr:peptide ABC transporter substrate-binding protein [Sulfitobacter brevis]SFE84870.1 peptide/nickel transport system substrate-binding protein [Sulfitobacter brevis]
MALKALLVGSAAALMITAPASAERGTDGKLKLLYWQAPSILNPYLSSGIKDIEAASLVVEPLGRHDEDGFMVPYLAQEIPTLENGGVAADLKSITWSLKPDLTWSDGSPFTARDVKFTGDYCMDPEAGCSPLARFADVEAIEVIDDLTVTIRFKIAKPYPYGPFMGAQSPVLQAAQFANCMGATAPACTEENFNPIGTGPFVVRDFRPNDVIEMVANDHYRDPAKPAFASLTLKGGGDAAAAGRAVLETGEFDYAWNLQLAPDVLESMESSGKGTTVVAFGTAVERLDINMTDPSADLGPDERSTAAHPHPILSDARVREALSLAVDRDVLVEVGYGDAGRPTCNIVPAPALYASDNTACLVQDIDAANALLEAAGWDMGSDGIRVKDGTRLSLLFTSPTNAVRQDSQALIKDWWASIGVETELRNIDGSVFFSSDPGSPDTMQKFYADVHMFTSGYSGTDPEGYLSWHRCGNEPRPASQWQGENYHRFCDPAYDEMIDSFARTAELSQRGEIARKMNDMLTNESHSLIPLVARGRVSAHANTLSGVKMTAWDSELWNVADWYRTK